LFNSPVYAKVENYPIYELSYSLHEVKDQTYKQLEYHIIMQKPKDEVFDIQPIFNNEFNQSILDTNTSFEKTKKDQIGEGIVVNVLVDYNSKQFDDKKIENSQIIKGLKIITNDQKQFIKFNENQTVIHLQ
jgi:hypothetical protein